MSHPYADARLSVPERVEDLLARMTLAEKVGQLLQLDAQGDLEELVHGHLAGSLLHASPERIRRAQELAARTRLGIPLLMADDCIHGHSFWPGATIFPTQLAMACTFDPGLVERGARVTAAEVAATGLHWTFSPVLCIARDPRWGRVDETFGEDPHLIGELGAAMVRGYQGDGGPGTVLATAKHFVGYSQTQGGRDASEADLSRRQLRSWFLPPFQRAVEAGCRTVMLGYQAIDGVPITAHRWLLDEVLKGEWGFTGTLVTDWDNVGRMVWEQRVCADDVEAAVVAVEAGNDIVMTTPQFFDAAQEAVRTGRLAVGRLDAAVRRVLTLKIGLGLFEDARLPDPAGQEVIGSPAHTDVNLETARRGLVLLRNDGTLPLERHTEPLTVAVLGPNSDDPHAQLGDWAGASGQVGWMVPEGHPRDRVVTVLDGLRALAPPAWTVTHARGADIGGLGEAEPATFPDGQPRPPVFHPAAVDDALLAEAVDRAREADVAVVVLGDTVALTGESRSTATLELQGAQAALLEAVVTTGTPVVLVLVQSKPSVLPPAAEQVAALVEAFNPGMQGGRAVAELLLGLIEPSGRLPISFPRHAGQLPVYYNGVRGQHGDRYADLTQEPMFVFGEGLSYTTVEYADLHVSTPVVDVEGTVRARLTLRNTGARPALETVQVYVSDLVTSVTWADKELKAFTQVRLDPGEQRDVEITLPAGSCTIVDAEGRRRVEPGEFALLVGPSSRDADLLRAGFSITGGADRPGR